MAQSARSKSLGKAIDAYYARLDEFKHQNVLHEGAVSSAFQFLLTDAARAHHWTLIPQLGDKSAGRIILEDTQTGVLI